MCSVEQSCCFVALTQNLAKSFSSPVSASPIATMSSSSDDEKPLVSLTNGKSSHNHLNAGANPRKANGKRRLSSSSALTDEERPPTAANGAVANGQKQTKAMKVEDSSDDDVPLAVMTTKVPMPGAHDAMVGATSTKASRRAAVKSYKQESDDEDGMPPNSSNISQEEDDEEDESNSSDDEPLVKKATVRKAQSNGTAKRPQKKRKKSEETSAGDTDTEVEKPARKPKGPPKKKVKKEEEDVEMEDGTQSSPTKKLSKFSMTVTTSTFCPLSNADTAIGKPVDLPPESEEVASFFAAMIDTDHAQNATFRANFFKDWQETLKEYPPRNGIKIKELDKVDFRPMALHIETEKAKIKRMTKEEKKAAKEKKEKDEAPFATCMLNGRPEKKRVRPEDITINIGEGEQVPTPGMPGQWKEVIHDNTVTWLANWKENINGQTKYVFLAATSSIKGKSDRDKFEKARELKNHIDRIRQDYQADLKSKVTADRQRATAMYLIDKYALRAGNEKGEDEADTVGCCSLRLEHITLDKSGLVILDFLGKDSIRYYKEIDDIDPQVFKNLRLFKAGPKKDSDSLFDRVTVSLTAKVFRTYNASTTFEKELLGFDFKPNVLQQEKVNAYNAANKKAAELCNHQKAASKNHAAGMAKMALHHQRMGMKRELFHLEPKMKKKYSEWAEPESELEDEEQIQEFEDQYYEEKKKELTEGWERSKKTLEETGGTAEEIAMRKEKVDKKLEEVEADYNLWVKHRKKAGYSFRGKEPDETKEYTADQLVKLIEKQTEMINKTKLKQTDKENLKTISLGTRPATLIGHFRLTTSFILPVSNQLCTDALRSDITEILPDSWNQEDVLPLSGPSRHIWNLEDYAKASIMHLDQTFSSQLQRRSPVCYPTSLGLIEQPIAFGDYGQDIVAPITFYPSPRVSFHVGDADAIKIINLFGSNILSTEGDEWRMHRKIVAKSFTERNNKLVWEQTISTVLDLFTTWERDGRLGKAEEEGALKVNDVASVMRELTLMVISAA
ncbi:11356_t:CDS:10, partial [Acaulospora colombiana]